MGGKRSGKAQAQAQDAASDANEAENESKGEKPRHTCLHSQLHKTKFCLYHLKGACQFGSTCSFAHSCAELQATPDLRKTRLCTNFFEGKGCSDPDCGFAHCEDDLRSTDMFYKKTLCIWNEKRKCRNGDQCRFAHGLAELRANQGMGAASLAGASQCQDAGEKLAATDTGMGRQVSEASRTTSTSCGNLSSLTGGSSVDGSIPASTSTRSRPGRRGKRGSAGGAAGAGVGQAAGSGYPSPDFGRNYTGNVAASTTTAMPMKILPARGLFEQPALEQRPAQPQLQKQMPQMPVAPGTVPSAEMQDPVLQAELHRLRCSVSALAQTCNQLNDQICMETLRAQSAKLSNGNGNSCGTVYGASLQAQQAQAQQLLNHAAQGVIAQQLLSQAGPPNLQRNGRGCLPVSFPNQDGTGLEWGFVPGRLN